MASATRTLWKGAITFGLVHIPVGLHTAATESGVDFDWLDKRSMDPVGYKRINKRTGKEIDRDNIVKGVEYEDGKYVIISPEEIEKVYPRTTQTIEIVQFVDAGEIPFVYLERPYYLEPINKGQKVYALLRDVLQKTGKIGVAKVVIATKQHLAAVVPAGRALVLNLMRWGDEVRPLEGLDLPPESTKASTAETKMAVQLVKEMTAPWKPTEFEDEFKHKVMELVQKKVKAGETETVIEPEEEAPGEGAEVIDLSELLKRSLKGGGSSRKTSAAKTTSAASATKKSSAAKKSAPKKHAPTERKAA
ncbi:Ku protein [Xenophilus aerolatus]|nr:Ku protein [Xenophilus aerolatus]